jgi:hypothetical protein
MSITIQEFAKANKIRIHQAKALIKSTLGDVPATLTDEDIRLIKSSAQLNQTKALPQAQINQPQTELKTVQTEQPQEEQPPVNETPAPIQTTSNDDVALTQSDLAAIATIRETFGEAGVQVFLQKKRQELIVNKATADALRQHDEQELYQEVKLQVQNQLQIRDYIKEQQALDIAITQHAQLKKQRKEQIQKSNKVFDSQLTDLLNKQNDFNATMELLGISMI